MRNGHAGYLATMTPRSTMTRCEAALRVARLQAGQEEGEDPLGLSATRDAAPRQLQHGQQVVNDLQHCR